MLFGKVNFTFGVEVKRLDERYDGSLVWFVIIMLYLEDICVFVRFFYYFSWDLRYLKYYLNEKMKKVKL